MRYWMPTTLWSVHRPKYRPMPPVCLAQRRRIAAQPRERVVEEAEPGKESNDAAEVREHERQLVEVDVPEEVDAGARDGVRTEPADVPTTDAEDARGQQVEANETAGDARPALLCGSGR